MTLPQRLSFSAQLSNCNVATRWQVELSKLSRLQLSFNIHSSNGLSCPVKFFHLKIAIRLAFGRILAGACAATEKHLCPVSIPFSISVWRLSLANLQKSPSSKPRMLSGKDVVFLRTADSYADYAGICWHMLPFWVQPSPPFTRAMALCHVRGCGAERVACPADTLDKSRHKPVQEGQLPNPRSISLAKCTVQLPSLNLVIVPLQFWFWRSICGL